MESCISCTAIQATALAVCGRVPDTVLYLNRQETQRIPPAGACVFHLIPPRSFQTAPVICIIVDNVTARHWQMFPLLSKIQIVCLLLRAVGGKQPTKCQQWTILTNCNCTIQILLPKTNNNYLQMMSELVKKTKNKPIERNVYHLYTTNVSKWRDYKFVRGLCVCLTLCEVCRRAASLWVTSSPWSVPFCFSKERFTGRWLIYTVG